MEIKAKLNKPYTEKQRIDFIVENNHQLGYEIQETETTLEAWGYTEEEITQKEKERIAKLYLTGADVERGIYQAKGMEFDDIIAMVTKLQPEGLDIKALKIELKANNFYRGNPYVSVVGTLLGFTTEQLDKFFETKDYKYLTNITLTINTIPETAVVTLNGIICNSITVLYNTMIEYTVNDDSYIGITNQILLTDNTTLEIELEPIEQ